MMIMQFTINFAETCNSVISLHKNRKIAKITQKMKTREHRTIFFKLKRNVKINDESAKRI